MVYIITTAVNMQIEGSPFMRSLEKCCPPGDVELAVITGCNKYEPHIDRLFTSLEIVKQLPKDAKIILTDFRDVLFQQNPNLIDFRHLGIYFEHGRYGEEPYNTQWIQRDLGMVYWDWVKGNRITCCGVVTGIQPEIESYLQFMCETIESFDKIEHGADTSAHVKFVFNCGMFTESGEYDKPDYPVYTVGLCESIRVSRGKIITENGGIPVMVHQYDRHLP